MCGICGVVNLDNKIDLEGIIRKMSRTLQHRGPDDEGVYFDIYQDLSLGNKPAQIGLGHRRLSIIDLSASAHEPICNEDGTIWLTFNGEIYNFITLRKQLEKEGHCFKSKTDAEVLVHLYENYREGCLQYLYGMFAFAIWDSKLKQLFLARDRVGKKPLNYFYNDNKFVFASELSALLASGLIKPEIKTEALDLFFSLGYIPAPHTIYNRIFKIPAGSFLIFKEGNISIRKYWSLNYEKKRIISEEAAIDELWSLLQDAVRIRLYSDVPLGAFLSGGIDSSAVVGIMSKILGKNIKTFSIGFDDRHFDELYFARGIARFFDTDHHEFIVKSNALEILPLLVRHYGEPYADASSIPTYYVSRETRQHVTVALNGDGGDESFAGYERYQAVIFGQYYNNITTSSFRKIISAFMRLMPGRKDRKTILGTVQRLFQALTLPTVESYMYLIGIFDKLNKQRIYSTALLDETSNFSNPILNYFASAPNLNTLDRFLRIDVNLYLTDDLLVKTDIASMANSLELRSPFLDHRVMEFAAALPTGFKMRHFIKKYILKRMLKGFLPDENINRRKMGFGVPVGRWFRCELKDLLKDALLNESFLKRGYFNPTGVKNMIADHLAGKGDYSAQLWALLMFELWYREFISIH